MFLLYAFGTKRADMIQSVPLLMIMVFGMIKFARKVEQIAENAFNSEMTGMINNVREFLEKQFWLFAIIATICMYISYRMSVLIVEKKKEAA